MNFWVNNPGFRLLFPLALGIISAVEYDRNTWLPSVVGSFFLLLYLISFYFSTYKNRKLIGGLITLTVYFAGFQYTMSRTEKHHNTHYTNLDFSPEYYKVKVVDKLEEKENSFKTILEITAGIDEASHSKPCNGRVLTYFKKNEKAQTIQYGDELMITNRLTEVEESRNPNQFDYKNYLNLNQINFQVFLDSSSWKSIGVNSGNRLVSLSQSMRETLYRYLSNNGVVGDQLKVASALLLGYRENLDKELIKSYSSAGAMHVLAVSGLHVGILYLLISNLLKGFERLKKSNVFVALLLISILWFYALMTGLSSSVMRSSTMFTFIILGDKLLNRTSSIYNTLAVSAVVLLIINPYAIYQVGFQLSYAAVVGIVYLQPKLVRLIYVRNKILQKVWAITCVSVAAQLATFPLSLHYFHQFPVYFFVSNLIVIPSAVCIFYLGIALFISAPFYGISMAIGNVLNGVLSLLNKVIYFTESLPYSLIQEIELTVKETYLFYLILFFVALTSYYKRVKLLYVTLSLSVCLLIFQLRDQYSSIRQRNITFYSINNETAFEFIDGKSVYFFASNALSSDWNKMLFNVNNNWNTQNITKKIVLNVDSLPSSYEDDNVLIKDGVFFFGGKTLLLLDEKNYSFREVDITIISNESLNHFQKVKSTLNAQQLIFDSTIPSYKLPYYLKGIDTNQIQVISLAKHYHRVKL